MLNECGVRRCICGSCERKGTVGMGKRLTEETERGKHPLYPQVSVVPRPGLSICSAANPPQLLRNRTMQQLGIPDMARPQDCRLLFVFDRMLMGDKLRVRNIQMVLCIVTAYTSVVCQVRAVSGG